MPEVTGRCPMCQAELVVTRLQCQQCGTGLQGTFTLNKFDRLSREHLAFIDVFIKNRGVIRDVERELGISYPTVRNRLDEVVRALGYEAPVVESIPEEVATPLPDRRRGVLDRLGAGEITAQEAVRQLRGEAEER